MKVIIVKWNGLTLKFSNKTHIVCVQIYPTFKIEAVEWNKINYIYTFFIKVLQMKHLLWYKNVIQLRYLFSKVSYKALTLFPMGSFFFF